MLKTIKVKRDFTNLKEVLFENGKINSMNEFEKYINENQVNKDGKTLKNELRLMKNDIITIEK